MKLPHRRATMLASFALLLTPALTSCGFDYATDRDYTPAVGANDRSSQVYVLAAVVVAAESGEAVFLTSLSNTSDEEESTLETITGPEGVEFTLESPVELLPHGFANLADAEEPVTVEGDLKLGGYIPVTLDFSHGESISLEVPIRPNCGDYAEIDGLPAGEPLCATAADEDH